MNAFKGASKAHLSAQRGRIRGVSCTRSRSCCAGIGGARRRHIGGRNEGVGGRDESLLEGRVCAFDGATRACQTARHACVQGRTVYSQLTPNDWNLFAVLGHPQCSAGPRPTTSSASQQCPAWSSHRGCCCPRSHCHSSCCYLSRQSWGCCCSGCHCWNLEALLYCEWAAVLCAADRATDNGTDDDHDGDGDRCDAPAHAVPRYLRWLLLAAFLELPLSQKEERVTRRCTGVRTRACVLRRQARGSIP